MPIWTYKCQNCDAEVDVQTDFGSRDEEKRAEHKKVGDETEKCDGPLARLDQIENALATPHFWQP